MKIPHRQLASRPRAHVCPRCGSLKIERIPREKVVDRLLTLVQRRVYRCWICWHRFYDRPLGP
jgi:DNA-directed RNA polymerase subunit RPC12/RpoP